ncbi:hypothetical protein SFC43_17040 [Bacteroides sp. CR5/BHMF/2]|nr:hypothetical protein [Bacteroides sp. CR5/BHMF/2]
MRFYGCGTRLSVQLHTTAFPANYSFAERKNLQEMHFSRRIKRDSRPLHLIKHNGDGRE